MSYLYKDGAFQSDKWLTIDGDQPVPEGEDVIVSLTLFEEHQHALLTRNSGRLGVHLEAAEQLDAIVPHLDKFDVVSLDFPTFADGRAFSKARWLRDQHGYAGEVRAVGDVRIDQVSHMKRCGIDALLVTHQQTIDSLTDIKDPGLQLYYQPSAIDGETKAGGRAWARRA